MTQSQKVSPHDSAVESQQFRALCAGCGATLIFAAGTGTLKCEYCGSEVEIKTAQAPQDIVEYDLKAALESHQPERGLGRPMRMVTCQSCGASVQVSPEVAADRCDFCDSPRVALHDAAEQLIRPESLVPFLVDRDQAQQRFRAWLVSLWFRPNDLRKLASLREMAGIYVPYWTFDATVDSRWTAMSGYHYWETETYTTTENGRTVTKTRQVQKTRWVPSSGSRTDPYNDVLVCASRGLPVELVDRLDTFETSKLVPYDPRFLAGWKAENYAVDLPSAWRVGHERICQSQYARCAGDVPGDTHMNLNVSNRFSGETFKHIFLPIWIAAYRYHNRVYRFLVNGQTGEVEGKAPWSWLKITLLVLGIAAAAIVAAIVVSQTT
jgi:ribosomal protein S27E